MEIDTPHGPGRVFWSIGNKDFVRKAEGLSFVPDRFLNANFTLISYQASRYGELSARCWPSIRVAHALPDLEQEAEGKAAHAFSARLRRLLADIPRL